ncbi:MAG: transcriptional repressor [Tannerellaceae bacterium]|jgi:Fur family ferric uptake transcriptional regulator|nr:transcriptional repressor [Tannerellaceae bacterium]
MTESNMDKDIQDRFSTYLEENRVKERRKTEVRFTILKEICDFPKHFDLEMLQDKLDAAKYRVSRATLYNTLNVLIDAGIIVRHQFDAGIIAHYPHQKPIPIQYELRKKAETHYHFVCTRCRGIREVKNMPHIQAPGSNFTAEYASLCLYGLCNRCRNRIQREAQKNINQSQTNKSKK